MKASYRSYASRKRIDTFPEIDKISAMPFLTTNIASQVFEDIKALVEKGLYSSPEQFLEIAAFNQLALERGVKPADLPVRSRPSAPAHAKPVTPQQTFDHHRRTRTGSRPRGSRPGGDDLSERQVSAVLSRFSIAKCRETQLSPMSVEPRPGSERLWGQVNRLFPLKLACRWVAVASADAGGWLKHEVVSEGLVRDAANLGSILATCDARANRKRDEPIGIGLPRRGNLASHDRFLSQYIARTTRTGDIYPGAICQYALATFDGDRLVLNERGLALAQIENTILEVDPHLAIEVLSSGTIATLSEAEREFFVKQALAFVPGELGDLRAILRAIVDHHTTPDALLTAARPGLPEHWSHMMTRTHVSGVVARLAETGLIRRKWEGRNARYEPTPSGVEFAAEEALR